jgi:predicted nucleic acid-binding Zn ribbon protein
MRRRKPVSLGEVLDTFLKNLGVEKKVKEGMAVSRWAEIVGPYIAKVSIAERVENGVLYVKVTNPSWKHHLFMMRREIINKLNDSLKADVIREIVFIDAGYDFKNK